MSDLSSIVTIASHARHMFQKAARSGPEGTSDDEGSENGGMPEEEWTSHRETDDGGED